jgi:deazaflavin-dependent oxidoreductase (nitroreductase family)
MLRAMRPNGLMKALLRAPVGLYSIGAGRVLGHRFLLLVHRGRRTGRLYRSVLEVVAWRPDAREAVVISGFGRQAQWYKNVIAGGADEVRIAGLRFRPEVRVLESAEAVDVLAGYERRNRLVAPLVRALLSRLSGFPYDGSRAAQERVIQALPVLALRPAREGEHARLRAGSY